MHEPGAELWFQAGLKPTKFTPLLIDGEKGIQDNAAYYQVALKMRKVFNVNRKAYKCDPQMTLKSFTSCAFDHLRYKSKTDSKNCTSMVSEVNKKLTETNLCTDNEQFQDMKKYESDILEHTLINGSYEKCLKPCEKVEYSAELTLVHKNSKILGKIQFNSDDYTSLFHEYDDFTVQEFQEFIILDGGALLSSIGGFLGLFLGFSTLSIADWIHSKFNK